MVISGPRSEMVDQASQAPMITVTTGTAQISDSRRLCSIFDRTTAVGCLSLMPFPLGAFRLAALRLAPLPLAPFPP